MANEELGKLSPEQIQKLANTISEAKSLTSQQEEIIQRVLAGEIEIGNTRIASLERYFDVYSKNLDKVASKYSDINEAFLVLDGKLTENYKSLSSDIAKLERQQKKATKDDTAGKPKTKGSSNAERSTKKADTTKNTASLFDKETAGAIKQIANTISRWNTPGGIIGYNPSETNNNTSARDANAVAGEMSNAPANVVNNTPAMPADIEVSETINSEASRVSLEISDTSIEDLIAEYGAYTEKIGEVRKAINELNAANLSGDQARIDSAKASYELIESRFKEHVDALQASKEEYLNHIKRLEKEAESSQAALELARIQTQEMQAARLTEFRLKELDKVLDAEKDAQDRANQLAAEIEFANSPEAGEYRAREVNSKEELKSYEELAAKRAKYIADAERKARLASEDGKLSPAVAKRIKEEANAKFKADKENLDKITKERLAREEAEEKKKKRSNIAETDQKIAQAVQLGGFSKEDNLLSRMDTLKSMVDSVDDDDKGAAQMAIAIKAISSLVAQLESKIDQIGSYKGDIDTRLQGSNNKTVLGSYWDQLNRDMMSVGAVTPFFKQEDFANNIKSLVDRGIAFDLKQRAFLMTIQSKIANTFDVADGTLLRLIRIQQEDSTAGRLGMESALNSFLNEMYENTEYLKDVAAQVRGSLQEMESLMTGAEATEVEYQVQKWMGSLYSVGMSQEAVQSIANAFGQIAAGQVDALTNGNGAGNLLVMAANEAGIPIADILTDGLDAKETNKLLQATVNYLAEIAESTKGNNVVQQQLAGVFGVKASDLRAATNLTAHETTDDVFKEALNYDNMLNQLNKMAGSMIMRTSIGEMMTNIWENGQYTLASSMANNPISYLLFKGASLLEETTGGISLPFLNVYGFGVDLETTVADLMRVASISSGILGSIGPMISGLASSFSGQAMLTKMGIDKGSGLKVTPRGNGEGVSASDAGGGAKTTSSSGYVGNASGSDIKDSTIQESEDTKKQHMIEAKEEAEATQIDFINNNVLKIYELLDEVTNGKRSFNVKVSGYGLTRLNNSNALGSAQGGVAGLLSNNAAGGSDGSALNGGFTSGGGGSANSNSNSVNNGGQSNSGSGSFGNTSIGLGGWTIL